MPIEWNQNFINEWTAFIQAYAAQFDGNPNIYSIQMAGWGYIGEMALPDAQTSTITEWNDAGYTDQNYETGMKSVLSAYVNAFHITPLNVDITEPLGSSSHVLDGSSGMLSYIWDTYPHKVYMQQNGLQANYYTSPSTEPYYKDITNAAAYTTSGFQMYGGQGNLNTQTGDRLEAFEAAVCAGVSYVEVYDSDIAQSSLQSDLDFLATKNANGAVSFSCPSD
jgi:hypothetical protein